jgi:GNAT superfamily N-acetyltransferase
MRLRRAARNDLEQLVRWSRDFEHGAHGEPFIERTFEEFERSPGRGEIVILESPAPAGGAGGRDAPHAAVGYAILVSWWSNEFRGEALLLDELYVAPEHRGGTGRAALQAIEELARSRGVKLISLEVLPETPRVHSLYQKAGYSSGRTLYQRRLT